MPSPFPGMDPYLEAPEIWVDFHNNLASQIQATLNSALSPRYIARLSPRVVYEVVEIGGVHSMRPDVDVHVRQEPTVAATAAQTATATTVAPSESVIPVEELVRYHSV
mgnify:CR=1 FL=1